MYYEKLWKKVLSEDERIEYEFSISPRLIYVNLVFWFVVGIATVWIYGVGVAVFFVALVYYGWFLRVANAYAFTNKRVLIYRGWLSTNLTSVDFSRITDIEVNQGFSERIMYNVGTIYINTAGAAAHEVVLTRVQDPYGLKQKLADLMEKHERESPHTM